MKKSLPVIIIGLLVLGSLFYISQRSMKDEMDSSPPNGNMGMGDQQQLRDGSGDGMQNGKMENDGMGPKDGTGVRNQMDEMEETMMDKDMSYVDISPMEAKELIDNNPDLIIVDVSPLYDDGHLPGAINAPVGNGTLDEMIPDWDPEAMYLVYCHGDAPSILGAQKLVNAGFENVYRLEGNYSAWVDAGYEIEM